MKKILFAIILVVLFLGIFLSVKDYDHSNEVIIFGGDIITMDEKYPNPEAVFVKDGIIKAVGALDEIEKLKSQNTKNIDLKGQTLMPGFIDPHGHLDQAVVYKSLVDLNGIVNKKQKDVWDIVSQSIKNTPKGEWIFFKDLNPILTEDLEITLPFLDSIAPDHPVLLITMANHAFYANSKAFKEVGITKYTPDPSKDSYYQRDSLGNLTGLFIEQAAIEPFRPKIQAKIKTDFIKNLNAVLEENASLGITGIVSMGLLFANENTLKLYQHLFAEKSSALLNGLEIIGKLPERKPTIRNFIYLKRQDDHLLPESSKEGDDFYKILGIKFWYDGSPYAGSMLMRKAYLQSKFTIDGLGLKTDHVGEAIYKEGEFDQYVSKYVKSGWKIAVHCQGDRAINEAVSIFSNIHKNTPIHDQRIRIEHCLMLPHETMSDMKRMNISPSFHINHLLYYGDFLKSDILGEERAARILPVKKFTETGVPYSLHADQPMFNPYPLLLASTAINRKTASGTLVGESEKISVYEALKSITIHSAWQINMEDKLGSISTGKYADLVILDKNPLKVDPYDISKIKVQKTFVAGHIIWETK